MKIHNNPEMTEFIKNPDYKSLLGRVSTLIEEARRKAVNLPISKIPDSVWKIQE